MTDANGHIFISYAREDRGRVAILAQLFEAEGWPVWWDRVNMSAGRPLNVVIGEAIDESSLVLVCWSRAAIQSRWVIDEATEGLDQEKLLPVLFDAVKPPLGFRNIHHINLTGWDEKESHTAYQRLKAELTKTQPLVETDGPTQDTVPTQKTQSTTYPENVQRLLDKVTSSTIGPIDRLAAGDELAKIGDPRPGVGLDAEGLPDIDWVEIPAGEFLYGEEKQTMRIDRFYMARYPVTNEQYDTFIKDGGYGDERWWRGLSQRTEKPEMPSWQHANRPRESVSWYEAFAFCRWLSEQQGFEISLPTEHQWGRAARGADGRDYPWGEDYHSGYANVNEKGNKDGPHYLEQSSTVGMYAHATSPEGILDLSGNVWEWVLNEYYNPDNVSTEGDNPRVLRGGSWSGDPDDARASDRDWGLPDYRLNDIGFRVVCSSPT